MLGFKAPSSVLGVQSYVVLVDEVAATAYTDVPEDLFPGMGSDGTDLTIPIASMTDYGLTAAHCVPGSGDARQLARCLTSRIKDWYFGLETAAQPAAMTVSVRRGVNGTTGNFPNGYYDQYTFKFELDWPNEDVADEPS